MIMTPMSEIQLPDAVSWGGALVLSDLGVIQADGPDAATFLHGQLSQDMVGQGANDARLAAYCSVKGRMMATALTLRPQAERFWLLTHREVLPTWLKRLSMFVMRAKAALTDASASVQVLGLLGPAASSLTATLSPGSLTTAPYPAQAHAGGWLVRLPNVQGVARAMWVGPVSEAQAMLSTLPAATAAQWAWLDVLSGVAQVQPATADQFVPQMANYELVGGINFKKGCYPGQEVVARSQYRGTLKRRAFVAHAPGPVAPGTEVFSADDPGQPAGMVINAAPIPNAPSIDGQAPHSLLIELKLAARESKLTVGTEAGLPLTLGELPYDLINDADAV